MSHSFEARAPEFSVIDRAAAEIHDWWDRFPFRFHTVACKSAFTNQGKAERRCWPKFTAIIIQTVEVHRMHSPNRLFQCGTTLPSAHLKPSNKCTSRSKPLRNIIPVSCCRAMTNGHVLFALPALGWTSENGLLYHSAGCMLQAQTRLIREG